MIQGTFMNLYEIFVGVWLRRIFFNDLHTYVHTQSLFLCITNKTFPDIKCFLSTQQQEGCFFANEKTQSLLPCTWCRYQQVFAHDISAVFAKSELEMNMIQHFFFLFTHYPRTKIFKTLSYTVKLFLHNFFRSTYPFMSTYIRPKIPRKMTRIEKKYAKQQLTVMNITSFALWVRSFPRFNLALHLESRDGFALFSI
jgi:hypothetical protein